MAQRIDDLLEIVLQGAKLRHIRLFVRGKEREKGSAWELAEGEKPLSDTSLDRYRKQAIKAMIAETRERRKLRIARNLARREDVYAKVVLSADFATAFGMLKDEAKLLGMYAPVRKKIETSSAPSSDGLNPYVGLTEEQIHARLASLDERRRRAGTRPVDGVESAPDPGETTPPTAVRPPLSDGEAI